MQCCLLYIPSCVQLILFTFLDTRGWLWPERKCLVCRCQWPWVRFSSVGCALRWSPQHRTRSPKIHPFGHRVSDPRDVQDYSINLILMNVEVGAYWRRKWVGVVFHQRSNSWLHLKNQWPSSEKFAAFEYFLMFFLTRICAKKFAYSADEIRDFPIGKFWTLSLQHFPSRKLSAISIKSWKS